MLKKRHRFGPDTEFRPGRFATPNEAYEASEASGAHIHLSRTFFLWRWRKNRPGAAASSYLWPHNGASFAVEQCYRVLMCWLVDEAPFFKVLFT